MTHLGKYIGQDGQGKRIYFRSSDGSYHYQDGSAVFKQPFATVDVNGELLEAGGYELGKPLTRDERLERSFDPFQYELLTFEQRDEKGLD